ncbi:MAG TPA: hypothetical protein VJ949_05965 [Cryomorphaceae bacterium]|nr:hypothetical protein [Cryomorphaceae bacterium]
MKKFEVICSLLAILGFVLKCFQVPFSGVTLVLSLSALGMFYYSLSFAYFNGISFRGIFKRVSYRGKSAKRLVGASVMGLSLSVLVIGTLFKLQFWPMSSFYLMVGLFMLAAIFVFAIYYHFKTNANFYSEILKRTAVWGIIGTGLALTPDAALVDLILRDRPEAFRKLYKELMANPNDDELRKEVNRWEEEMYKEEDKVD